MPDLQDRVKVFGSVDVDNQTVVEFKNIPTDFCELKICGAVSHTLTTVQYYTSFSYSVEFQNSASNSKMHGLQARKPSAGTQSFTSYYFANQPKGVIEMGTMGPPQYGVYGKGEGQSTFELSVMEPGSSRAKMLVYKTYFTSNNTTWMHQNYGTMRIDSQQASSNADSKSVFDTIKISIGVVQAGSTVTWGPASSIWLEGWGGGHA
jgi:hypothetical protein